MTGSTSSSTQPACFARERHVTPDGLELTFATNVMAYFLLTSVLLGALKNAAAPGGIKAMDAAVADIPHREYRVQIRQYQTQLRRPPDCEGQVQLPSFDAAHMLARVLLTQEFAERLHGSGVVANAVSRGWSRTRRCCLRRVGAPFRWVTNTFGAPAEKAVDTALWLATSRESSCGVRKALGKARRAPTPGMGSDSEVRKRLWDACSHLARAGLKSSGARM